MNIIEQMLTGEMEMKNFVKLLHTDTNLQNEIRALVPADAIHNESHALWKNIAYPTFRKHNFDLISVLSWICKFDGTMGDNLNIWSTLKTVYKYSHPDLICTNKYEEAFNLYLDVIQDCYDGPEVEHIVEAIVQNALQYKTKKMRIETAKKDVRKAFHLEDRKRPYWIQGPEWPMGTLSPMKFVSRKRIGELVQYYFIDVNSGANRIVEQFY